jgi:hypothetical protein
LDPWAAMIKGQPEALILNKYANRFDKRERKKNFLKL